MCRIALTLLAQFYPGTLQENWFLILGCVIGYTSLSAILALFVHFKQRDAIMITKPTKVSQSDPHS